MERLLSPRKTLKGKDLFPKILEDGPQFRLAVKLQPLLDAQGVVFGQEIDIDASLFQPVGRFAVRAAGVDGQKPALVAKLVDRGPFRQRLSRATERNRPRFLRGSRGGPRQPRQGHPEQAERDGKGTQRIKQA